VREAERPWSLLQRCPEGIVQRLLGVVEVAVDYLNLWQLFPALLAVSIFAVLLQPTT
jgi:hypothetical protein